MKSSHFILISTYLLLIDGPLGAQEFTRENYIDYLPSPGSIISQTRASERLYLYGNPIDSLNYEDSSPKDGIDDKRAERLLYLAAKFSPILSKNNFSAPRDFEAMLRYKGQTFLYIDTWDLSGPKGRRILSDSINLALLRRTFSAYTPKVHELSPEAQIQDQKLEQLLGEFSPNKTLVQQTHPEENLSKVLYLDFPGKDEKSWKKVYSEMYKKDLSEKHPEYSRIYAHPFIHEETSTDDSARYEFVIQYWLFYPFNDGGNNHEGDWEHINVRVTTLERKGGLLSAADITRLLDHTNAKILDSLVIQKVDYYFHHFVMTLDYQKLDFLLDEKRFNATLRAAPEDKTFQSWVDEQIYYRLHLFKDSLNTHPMGYIGADNMGLDQIISGVGGKNRNSHGTYPFPGVWTKVGPLGATERVHGEKNYEFLPPPIYPSKVPIGRISRGPSEFKAVPNPKYVTYTVEEIELVPDWERVRKLVFEDPQVRRRWFWLALPIRWGFPVVKSPGAGFMKHVDMGNTAPIGPAFNSGWNRVGPAAGFEAYDPHILPSQYQMSLQDNFNNNLGYLNLSYPTWMQLPVLNLIWFFTFAQFQNNPKFVPLEELPFRFASEAFRPFYAFGDNDFARLLPQAENPMVQSFLQAHPGARINTGSLQQENTFSYTGFMFNLHIGKRFSSENTFTASNSEVSYNIIDAADQAIGQVTGRLLLQELAGSMRYNILPNAFQPFLRAGYGWSWYKVNSIKIDGKELFPSETEWFHNPTFPYLPNTFHFGAGVEFFMLRNKGLWRSPAFGDFLTLGRPDWGFRVDYALYLHGLGDDAPADRNRGTTARQEIGFGIVIGF